MPTVEELEENHSLPLKSKTEEYVEITVIDVL